MQIYRRDVMMVALGVLVISVLLLFNPGPQFRETMRWVGLAALVVMVVMAVWGWLDEKQPQRPRVRPAGGRRPPNKPPDDNFPYDESPDPDQSRNRQKLKRAHRKGESLEDGAETLKDRAWRRVKGGDN